MTVTAAQVKELRDRTNVSMGVCKKALEATDGDIEKAIEHMRVAGELRAADLVNRTAQQGAVISYVHPGNLTGAIVQVQCETDFVAKSEDFLAFCRDVAMHVVASKPVFLRAIDSVGSEWLKAEEKIILDQMANDPKMANKPQQMKDKILSGKINKRIQEVTLLDQEFVKDPDKTVEQLRVDLVQKTGENIQVTRFSRFDIRET